VKPIKKSNLRQLLVPIGKFSFIFMLEMQLVPEREQSACFELSLVVMFPYGNM
jgi:hypothetical protein